MKLLSLLFSLVLAAPLQAGHSPGVDPQPDSGTGPCNAVTGCRVVGPGGGLCEFAGVQAAVNTGAVEVRVVLGTYAESVTITDRTVTVIGGYASCATAANGAPPPSLHSTLAPASGRALNVQQTSSSAMTVEMRYFDLRGNTNADGGGVRVAGNAALTPRSLAVRLVDVLVRNDPAALSPRGGGVLVQDATLDLASVTIAENAANFGAGLHCQRAQVSQDNVDSLSILDRNTATLHGGGAYVAAGCELVLAGAVTANRAGVAGGGVYVAAGGSLFTGPDSGPNRALFNFNVANTSATAGDVGGGAIFATGAAAAVDVTNTEFSYNFAGTVNPVVTNSVGGAIAVTGGASLLVRRLSSPCWNPQSCVLFYRNSLAGRGGAIYANTSSAVRIADSRMERNDAKTAVLEIVGSGATTVIENNSLVSSPLEDTDPSSVVRLSGGNVVLRSNLIADNTYGNAAIELNFVNAEILGTTVWQPGRVKYLNIGGGPEAITRCVFSDSASAGWPASAVGVFNGDPIFRQPYVDYRIYPVNGSRISDVVDRCLPAQLQSGFAGVADLLLDAQGAARNTDLAAIGNSPGPIDIGPYEVQEYPGDLLFRDAFELVP